MAQSTIRHHKNESRSHLKNGPAFAEPFQSCVMVVESSQINLSNPPITL